MAHKLCAGCMCTQNDPVHGGGPSERKTYVCDGPDVGFALTRFEYRKTLRISPKGGEKMIANETPHPDGRGVSRVRLKAKATRRPQRSPRQRPRPQRQPPRQEPQRPSWRPQRRPSSRTQRHAWPSRRPWPRARRPSWRAASSAAACLAAFLAASRSRAA